ncbi:MAG: PH domain-containing protein [Anaerolineae bacterium]
MDNTWRVEIRRGWIVGLALVVVLIAATVGLVVYAVVTPLSLVVFLAGLGACVTLALVVRILYQLWGLINASYELDRNALMIHWGPVQHQVPMGSVREVLSGAKLKELKVRFSLRWPGYFVAIGRAETEAGETADPLLFYATRSLDQQVVLRTDGAAYAVSPADRDKFLVALRERLEMGPTQEVEERSSHPAFLDWAIWRDGWALGMLLGSVALLVILVGVLAWQYPMLPQQIGLRLTPDGEPLLLASRARLFYLVAVAAAFLMINGGVGLFFYRRERPLSYFLWSGLLATIGSLWAAVLSILLLQ